MENGSTGTEPCTLEDLHPQIESRWIQKRKSQARAGRKKGPTTDMSVTLDWVGNRLGINGETCQPLIVVLKIRVMAFYSLVE